MKGTFGKIMVVLVFLALVANLVVTVVTGDSPVAAKAVRFIVFGALAAANLFLAGSGIYFVSKAIQKREKTSLSWARRGFIAYVVGTVLLGCAPWFFYLYDSVPLEDRLFDVSLLLLLFGLVNGIFTLSFYREYLRIAGSRPQSAAPRRRRHRSKRSGSPHVAEQPGAGAGDQVETGAPGPVE